MENLNQDPALEGLEKVEQQAFTRAVNEATERATQNIAKIHRRRLVAQTAAITAVIVSVVAIGITLVITSQTSATAKADSQFNCRLFTSLASIMGDGKGKTVNGRSLTFRGKPQGFVSSDSLLLKQQSFDRDRIAQLREGALKKLLQDPETVRLTKQSQTLESHVIYYWTRTLIPSINDLARINCSAAI